MRADARRSRQRRAEEEEEEESVAAAERRGGEEEENDEGQVEVTFEILGKKSYFICSYRGIGGGNHCRHKRSLRIVGR